MDEVLKAECRFTKMLFADKRSALIWLVLRLYVGWAWLTAGWGKVMNPEWVGSQAVGEPIEKFASGALAKAAGEHPSVQWWYASFLENFVLPCPEFWSHFVAFGELLVGIGLIVGVLTGVAAFFGAFMNLNYLLAGTVSVNPILFTLSIGIILAWRVAGYWGGDRFVLPRLLPYLRRWRCIF